MFQNLRNEMQESFKPLMNIVSIQTSTAQKLAREQMDFMNECLEVGTQQAQTLRGKAEPAAFFSVPVDTGRALSERLVNTAGRQWSILMEARDAFTGEFQSAAQEVESTVKRASAEADKVTRKTAEKAASSDSKTSSGNTSSDNKTSSKS